MSHRVGVYSTLFEAMLYVMGFKLSGKKFHRMVFVTAGVKS